MIQQVEKRLKKWHLTKKKINFDFNILKSLDENQDFFYIFSFLKLLSMFHKSVLLLFLFLFSCDKSITSKDFYKDFDNNRWAFNHEVEFNIKINKGDELWIHFGHIYDYDYDLIPLELEFTKHESSLEKIALLERTILIEELKLKNSNGEDVGECLGDICDYYQKVNLDSIEPGNYHLVIRNKSDLPFLPNVLGIGYEVRKINQK